MKERIAILCLLTLISCRPGTIPSIASPTAPFPSPTRPMETATRPPTSTPTSTPRPLPPLPPPFQTTLLNPLDTPHTYLQDTCAYLQDKWQEGHSAPGTVVMVIMFHSIGNVTQGNQISEADFQALMYALHRADFQAITTAQLVDFLEHNAYIPPRSVMFIVDDRRYRQYFDTYFRPYYDLYGWPVVNAWISSPQNTAFLWQQQVELEQEGWVDHQAHGVVHNQPISEESPDAYILGELQGSVEAFQQYFRKAPLAFIWPGGGFNKRAVELARQSGYRLGFTINPRGPLMFNWIPLADIPDPRRPFYLPEGEMNDPLMVLPRYWATDAIQHLDAVIKIGQAAEAYANEHKALELEYYAMACASE